jgi:hypothetical protein
MEGLGSIKVQILSLVVDSESCMDNRSVAHEGMAKRVFLSALPKKSGNNTPHAG